MDRETGFKGLCLQTKEGRHCRWQAGGLGWTLQGSPPLDLELLASGALS